jgi:NAD(P)-dependent dehydrogenase (short-subunit alcohol dehydrogenase family)
VKILITGGEKGLGKQIKEFLFYEDVTSISRSNGYDLDSKKGLLKAIKLIRKIKPDVLILNAGKWDNSFFLNYISPKELSEEALKINPTCHVIFILSNAAYQSYGNDDYTASKSGLLHYARRKQREKFSVSTISPGTIDTDFWKGAKVDNRKRGAIHPELVAMLVSNIIAFFKADKSLITELIILPEVKDVN